MAEPHHALPAQEVAQLLGSHTDDGLDHHEAGRRLDELGPNSLPVPHRRGAVVRLLLQLHDPLVYVLVAAGVAAAALGEVVDASVIAVVVVANAVIGFVQEQKAQSALDALSAMVPVTTTVVRSGQAQELAAEHVVPGDLVLLGEGDRVPADLRLAHVDELSVDESTLTGESLPAGKVLHPLPGDTLLADRVNMAWSGTFVTRGRARGVVIAHGADTELGRVHGLVEGADSLATPLTRSLAAFSRILTVSILGLAVVALIIGLLRGQPLVDIVTAAVALAVAAIPEGLPAVVTITLAIGVTRMARRGAIVRRLPAVETLGSTTTICTDKTGTLTQNQQTVQQVVTTAGRHAPGAVASSGETDTRERAQDVLIAGVLCNDARTAPDGRFIGDPTETALLTAAELDGMDVRELTRLTPRTATVPFSSERRLMATRHPQVAHLVGPAPKVGTGAGDDDHDVVYVKGAAEAVLARCIAQRGATGGREPLLVQTWHKLVDTLAADGLRVLACAVGTSQGGGGEHDVDDLDGAQLEMLGLVAMADPP